MGTSLMLECFFFVSFNKTFNSFSMTSTGFEIIRWLFVYEIYEFFFVLDNFFSNLNNENLFKKKRKNTIPPNSQESLVN